MAVFRVERTHDYTVMSNYHLKDKRISLKAKGLLSLMLSLPDDWDYTLAGLSKINRESKDAIRTAINELENAGYVTRYQTVDQHGRYGVNEYVIYERPVSEKPSSGEPLSGNPTTEISPSEKPTQLNTKRSITKKQNKDLSNIDSIPSSGSKQKSERKRKESMSVTEMECYREQVMENIAYETVVGNHPYEQENIDEIVELLVETICSKRKTVRIAGNDMPHEVVKSRLLKLTDEHIELVLDSMKKNTTEIRNIKQYLLAVLYNAPMIIHNHYSAQANHDMHADGWQ